MSEQLPPQGRITDPPPQNEPRLESWGEIATHLRRDIRTAQRWEKEFGLPVRRLTIGKHAQVAHAQNHFTWPRRALVDAQQDGPTDH